MLGHVRCKHEADHPLPDGLLVVPIEIREDVVILLLQQFEGAGDVVVFQDRLVVVSNGKLVSCFNQVDIVETRMLMVMHRSSD